MVRLWLLIQGKDGRASVILTGDQLQREGVHPLRCVYLGSFESTLDPVAVAKAKSAALTTPPEQVISRNVRRACDSDQTRRWRLSGQELNALRAGEQIEIRDRIGQFTIGYWKQK